MAAAAVNSTEVTSAAPSLAAAAPAAAASPDTPSSTAATATDKAAAPGATAAAADKPAAEKKTVSLAYQTNPFQATFTATPGGFGSALASNSNSLFGSLFGSTAPGTLTAFTSFASSSAPE
jgi:hypothetical protein